MQADEREKGTIARFFTEEGKKLSGYVRRRLGSVDEMDAEDIVGDVMLSLLGKAGITTRVQSLPAYVYRALINRIVDYQRSRMHTVSLQSCMDENGEITLIELLADHTSVSVEAERREFFRRLAQAIDRLDAKQRAVFLATEFDGRSYKALSAEWKEPVGTLLSRKSRALKALREMLKDYGNE